jgi:hypothetical protein
MCSALGPKKFLQVHEDLGVGAVTLDAMHILQLAHLLDHLFQAVIRMDEEPDAALRAAT